MHYGYHQNCPECRAFNLEKTDQAISHIKKLIEKPNYKPQTSAQMRIRANQLRDMATSIKINGGTVRSEYESS